MNESKIVHDDKVGLSDLWEELGDRRRYAVRGAVVGVVGAVVTILLIAPRCEATTTFRVANIGGVEVEALAWAVERFKLPEFLLSCALAVFLVDVWHAWRRGMRERWVCCLIRVRGCSGAKSAVIG